MLFGEECIVSNRSMGGMIRIKLHLFYTLEISDVIGIFGTAHKYLLIK